MQLGISQAKAYISLEERNAIRDIERSAQGDDGAEEGEEEVDGEIGDSGEEAKEEVDRASNPQTEAKNEQEKMADEPDLENGKKTRLAAARMVSNSRVQEKATGVQAGEAEAEEVTATGNHICQTVDDEGPPKCSKVSDDGHTDQTEQKAVEHGVVEEVEAAARPSENAKDDDIKVGD